MTTIAWDGKSLAGDRKRTFGSTPMPCTKVFRAPAPTKCLPGGVLFGCAGDSFDAHAFRTWIEAGEPDARPTFKNLGIIGIDAQGRCWQASDGYSFIPVSLPKWAGGSGADYALGAMACGKTAAEAVEIAITLDNSSGLGVDVLTLDSPA